MLGLNRGSDCRKQPPFVPLNEEQREHVETEEEPRRAKTQTSEQGGPCAWDPDLEQGCRQLLAVSLGAGRWCEAASARAGNPASWVQRLL